MSQLTFEWPSPPSYHANDFIVSAANTDAVQFLDHWPQTSTIALIKGHTSSGKTHLCHRFSAMMGAQFIDSQQLGKTPSETLWDPARCGIVEDIDTIHDETAFFHLLRYRETMSLSLLLTTTKGVEELNFTLPDLYSRLRSIHLITLQEPDDTLLRHFLIKAFADRQLRIQESIIDYMIARMDRSFAAAINLVNRIEQQVFREKKDVTIPFLRNTLGQLKQV